MAIKTMRKTGADMMTKYKATARGGLAPLPKSSKPLAGPGMSPGSRFTHACACQPLGCVCAPVQAPLLRRTTPSGPMSDLDKCASARRKVTRP